MRDFTGVSGATEDGLAKETPAPSTQWPAALANAIVQELRLLVTHPSGGDVALNPGDNTQVLAAILKMIGAAVAGVVTVDIVGTEKTVTFAGGLLILKQGYLRQNFTSEVTVPIAFQTPFPGDCWSAMTQGIISSASMYRDLWTQVIDPTRTKNGFTVQLQSDDDNDHGLAGFDWWAIGN